MNKKTVFCVLALSYPPPLHLPPSNTFNFLLLCDPRCATKWLEQECAIILRPSCSLQHAFFSSSPLFLRPWLTISQSREFTSPTRPPSRSEPLVIVFSSEFYRDYSIVAWRLIDVHVAARIPQMCVRDPILGTPRRLSWLVRTARPSTKLLPTVQTPSRMS